MTAATSLFYWNEKFGKTDPRVTTLMYKITGAKTVTQLPVGGPVSVVFDGYTTQAQIDNFLGTTNEFLLADLDSSAVGADSFAGLINMQGQASFVSGMVASCYSSTGGSTAVVRAVYQAALTSSVETAVQLGANGNIAFKIDFGNTPDFDGLTDGLILINIYWIST